MFKNWAIKTWLGLTAAIALIAGAGLLLLFTSLGRGLHDWSFDLPYVFRSHQAVTNVAIVYLDRASLENLGQSWPADRRIYAELLGTMKQAGARMVIFDIFFKAEQPQADAQFAAALRQHGNVILGGVFENNNLVEGPATGVLMGQFFPPIPSLRTNARAWGLLTLAPVDYRRSARVICTCINEFDSIAWAAAKLDGAEITRVPNAAQGQYWLNYYGPARSLAGVSLSQALKPELLYPNFFQGKVVFVGADPSLLKERPDVFVTPYSRIAWGADAQLIPGVEAHATAYANLVRSEWLRRVSDSKQALIIVLWGALVAVASLRLPPKWAILSVIAAGLLLGIFAIALQVFGRLWWAWLIPAAVQTSLALVSISGWRYLAESRQQQQLRQAFAAYLSPHIADTVAEENFDLTLGGKEMAVTILFTDLENFTRMCETLEPSEVSAILIAYFEQTSSLILAQDGTIIKYIGDSVMAVWGAPVAIPDQADRAIKAALGISQVAGKQIYGRQLKTRIGINSGIGLAGNLGSKLRFDYTVIGANVNYASRLEGLNKYFGTNILISESTHKQLGKAAHVRCLGNIVVQGTTKAAPVYELLDLNAPPVLPPWHITFDHAIAAFQARDLDSARAFFQQVIEQREGGDGPSSFYLDYLDKLPKEASGKKWTGAVDMSAK